MPEETTPEEMTVIEWGSALEALDAADDPDNYELSGKIENAVHMQPRTAKIVIDLTAHELETITLALDNAIE